MARHAAERRAVTCQNCTRSGTLGTDMYLCLLVLHTERLRSPDCRVTYTQLQATYRSYPSIVSGGTTQTHKLLHKLDSSNWSRLVLLFPPMPRLWVSGVDGQRGAKVASFALRSSLPGIKGEGQQAKFLQSRRRIEFMQILGVSSLSLCLCSSSSVACL